VARNVLYLIPNPELGGAEKASLLFMSNHDRTKYDPQALFFSDGQLVEEVQREKIPTHVLKSKVRLSRPISIMKASKQLIQIIRSQKIEIIHCCMTYSHLVAGLPARLSGARVTVFQHGPVGTWMDRLSSGLPCDHMFTNSQFLIDKQGAVNLRKVPMSIVYIASGSVLEAPEIERHKIQVNSQYSLTEDNIVMGIIARFDPGKGIDLTITAAAPLLKTNPKLRLMIIGGPYRDFHKGYEQYLYDLVNSYGVKSQVIFTGFHRDVNPLMSRLDIVIQASTSELGFGLTVVEGMKLGKTVVVTESCREIVDPMRTGMLYPAASVSELTKSLKAATENRSLRETIGRNARESIRELFSIKRMMHSIESVYDRF
jgi:glycosyltransferase involved in cell wall biosynthesis